MSNEVLNEIRAMRVENLETQLRIQKESAKAKAELKQDIHDLRLDFTRLNTRINTLVPFVTLFFTGVWTFIKVKVLGLKG